MLLTLRPKLKKNLMMLTSEEKEKDKIPISDDDDGVAHCYSDILIIFILDT